MTALSNRQAKIARKQRGTTPSTAQPSGPKPVKPKHYEHDTGLAWLHHKDKLTRPQVQTGERYGRWYRGAMLTGTESLRGSNFAERVDCSIGFATPSNEADAAAYRVECIEKLSLCRSLIQNHDGMTMALDYICGRQMRPMEIIPDNQQLREELVNGLRIALDMLERVR